MKRCTVVDPLYHITCYFFRGTPEQIVAAFAKLPTKELRQWARAEISVAYLHGVWGTALRSVKNNKKVAVVCVATGDSITEQQDTLLHEILHVVDDVFASRGVWRKGQETGETLPYYVTWMFREARKGLGL